MLFSSTIFLFVFLPLVLAGYYILRPFVRLKNYFLLAASLFFYAWGEPVYVLLMIGSITGNFLFGLLVDKAGAPAPRRFWLALSVAFNLGALFFFKYLNFAADNLGALLGITLDVPKLSLPIGISFFTFQAMSYVIDVYRRTTEVQKDPLYLALYISFFPQLIAGPIVRYNTIAHQIRFRQETLEAFTEGIYRFIQGFAKKVLLSNVLSLTAEQVFTQAAGGEALTVLMAWLGALSYTMQIYFDFSGYSDMAIGLGKMFGFEFEENFRHPYMTRSISEFWNRWHISLGQWFRDYVYFPLGGSRVSKGKLLRNLLIVWLLTGIWHGAAWQYILWGLYYGVLISFEKFTGLPGRLSRGAALAYRVLSLLLIVFSFVLFGAQGVGAAAYQVGAMLGIGARGLSDAAALFALSEYWPFLLAGLVCVTPAIGSAAKRLPQGNLYHLGRAVLYLGLLMISVSYLAMGAHNPFIYFHF